MKITSKRGKSTTTVEIETAELASIGQIIDAAARSLETVFRSRVKFVSPSMPNVMHDELDQEEHEEHHDEDGSVRVVVPFRRSELAPEDSDGDAAAATTPSMTRIVAGVPYVPLTPREQLARGEWAASHEDVGQHDTWKYVTQYALWRYENPEGRLPKSWSGRSADHGSLFPLHPQLCEAMRRLHPWRLLAAAMGAENPHEAMLTPHGRARIDGFLTAHIEAAKAEAHAIYERCMDAENAGGPTSPYATPADAEAQFVIFPSDLADVSAWTSWPDLYPIPEGKPEYE